MSGQAPIAACVQMCSTPDVEANLDTVGALTRRAAADGAQLVAVPEAFAYLGPDEGKRAILEPLPAGGPILHFCQELARELDIELILGGFHEAGEPTEPRNYNTSIHLGRDGSVRATYRKIHLFDVDLADGTRLEESARTAPGDVPVTTDTVIGRVGMTICYDLRFPALYERLADAGATVMTVPSAFTATTGKDHWHVLLRARAIETQSWILAPAQWGHHYGERRSFGHTLIVDPWGLIVAERPKGDGVALAVIDPERTQAVRCQLPSLRHRRL